MDYSKFNSINASTPLRTVSSKTQINSVARIDKEFKEKFHKLKTTLAKQITKLEQQGT
tara:strand:+ start:6164 stop:6337 length:174 start_codon:yes stop_codon:yes gene_type:complete